MGIHKVDPEPPARFTDSFDAYEWAKAFVEIAEKNPGIQADIGTMLGWFANAMMRGYDEGIRQGSYQHQTVINSFNIVSLVETPYEVRRV